MVYARSRIEIPVSKSLHRKKEDVIYLLMADSINIHTMIDEKANSFLYQVMEFGLERPYMNQNYSICLIHQLSFTIYVPKKITRAYVQQR